MAKKGKKTISVGGVGAVAGATQDRDEETTVATISPTSSPVKGGKRSKSGERSSPSAAQNTAKTKTAKAKTAKAKRTATAAQQVTPSPAGRKRTGGGSEKKNKKAPAKTPSETASESEDEEEQLRLVESIVARVPPSPQANAKGSADANAASAKKKVEFATAAVAAAAQKKNPAKIPHKRGRGGAKTKTKVRFAPDGRTDARRTYRRPALLGALAATAVTGLYCRASVGWTGGNVPSKLAGGELGTATTATLRSGQGMIAKPQTQRSNNLFHAFQNVQMLLAADAAAKDQAKVAAKAAAKADRAARRAKERAHKKETKRKRALQKKVQNDEKRQLRAEKKRQQKVQRDEAVNKAKRALQDGIRGVRRGVGSKIREVGGFLKRTVQKDSDALFL